MVDLTKITQTYLDIANTKHNEGGITDYENFIDDVSVEFDKYSDEDIVTLYEQLRQTPTVQKMRETLSKILVSRVDDHIEENNLNIL